MALSDYAGRTPRGSGDDTPVRRVSRHRHWDLDGTARATCVACDAEIRLDERHVLATLEGDGPDHRRYLCDEACLAAWVGDARA